MRVAAAWQHRAGYLKPSSLTTSSLQVILTQPKAMRSAWVPAWRGVYDAEKLLAAVDAVVLPDVRHGIQGADTQHVNLPLSPCMRPLQVLSHDLEDLLSDRFFYRHVGSGVGVHMHGGH